MARLQELTRQERDERRGLEQRAGQLVAASTVGLGLLTGAMTRRPEAASAFALLAAMGGATMVLLGMANAAKALVPDGVFSRTSRRGRRARKTAVRTPPVPRATPTRHDLASEAQRVGDLERGNVAALDSLWWGTALVAGGVYIGVAAVLLDVLL